MFVLLPPMEHRGEIIKQAIDNSGMSVTEIAKRLKKSRQWIYNLYDKTTVPYETILEIGKIIHHNFSKEIKNLDKALSDPEDQYESQLNNPAYWREKYYTLLDEYYKLLKKEIKD